MKINFEMNNVKRKLLDVMILMIFGTTVFVVCSGPFTLQGTKAILFSMAAVMFAWIGAKMVTRWKEDGQI